MQAIASRLFDTLSNRCQTYVISVVNVTLIRSTQNYEFLPYLRLSHSLLSLSLQRRWGPCIARASSLLDIARNLRIYSSLFTPIALASWFID